ncbi:AAA domain-containing protein [Catellatospora aurea]|uniref:AAA domain-containing protein n=1 Tax=Catellatospora aurea TaxID=1337874 RepID=A0ABW2H5S7_9ACTN
MSDFNPAAQAEQVITAVLADLRSGAHRGVVVDSPPGAGKSTLVVRAAAELATTGDPLMIVAQTNEQVDDLVERLAGPLHAAVPGARVGRLSRKGYEAPARIAGLANVDVDSDLAALGRPAVTIATAAKWAHVKDHAWRWAIVDEAYQMRSDALLAIAPRFERALFVGDPGQLDPFSIVENDRWRGLSWDPMQSAVSVLLRNNPELPVHRLPVSWRLPHTAEKVVAAAFYPYTGFQSGTGPGERRLTFATKGFGDTSYDRVLEHAAQTGWGLLELPARHTMRTDAEAVSAVAELARRLLQRGATAHSERGEQAVTAQRIAIGAAHRDQVAALRAALGNDEVTVDTANRLQGREYDVVFVLHPLSGRRDATAFHLEAGRLCVLASRHRHACVMVARAGIRELLDAHPSSEPVHLGEPVKFPDGWAANQTVMAHLESHRVRA